MVKNMTSITCIKAKYSSIQDTRIQDCNIMKIMTLVTVNINATSKVCNQVQFSQIGNK